MNAVCSPARNGAEMRWGKKVLPVRTDRLCSERRAMTARPSRCCTGLYPRNAANRIDTGGNTDIQMSPTANVTFPAQSIGLR